MTHRARNACCVGLAFCWLGATAILCQNPPNTARDGSPRREGSPEVGAAIFRKSCSVCHSIRQGDTKVGPSLYGELRAGSGHSEQTVRQIVMEGKGNMPSFQEKIDSGQMDDLIAYLKTL